MRDHGRHNLLNLTLGFIAVIISLCFLLSFRNEPTVVAASVFFAFICSTDSFYGKIPNSLNLSLVLTGFALSMYASGLSGLLLSFAGMTLGAALLLLPFLAGGFGAGDVKALGAVGALIGPYELLHVFVYMAFYGAGLALIYNLANGNLTQKLQEGYCSVKASVLTKGPDNPGPFKKTSKQQFVRFPYATAIAFGYYTFLTWGGVL